MYLPAEHTFPTADAPEALFQLMAAHPLGAWVCGGPAGDLLANDVPFLLDRERGRHGTLIGHVSRANPVWRALGPSAPSVVMFQGPQAYVTPGWYPGKAAHGKVVPTWDYAVVHAHGVARAFHEPDAVLDVLRRLTAHHEARQALPWSVDDAPAAFIDRMLQAVVGIEIVIDRLEGKLKASQDEALPDRFGTAQGLLASDGDGHRTMGALVLAAAQRDAGTSAGEVPGEHPGGDAQRA
ncbi:MAG: FMN-binding negative transcriptional regulator [Burkholderiaceae bacterium]|nr:FMN-binding negative transcriptional regulator [Burkholderiaceae bacterium]